VILSSTAAMSKVNHVIQPCTEKTVCGHRSYSQKLSEMRMDWNGFWDLHPAAITTKILYSWGLQGFFNTDSIKYSCLRRLEKPLLLSGNRYAVEFMTALGLYINKPMANRVPPAVSWRPWPNVSMPRSVVTHHVGRRPGAVDD
jgi:hypothetical protein